VIWTASIVSYVGTAMFDTASGWLMTNLSADPLAISLVQAAVSLPLFLFTLPAGALADVIDARRLSIAVELGIAVVSAILAALVSLRLVTVSALLVATFLLGVGGALSSPAWQSITPLLVPRQDMDSAIAANSVGYNLSRAVGPALGGIVIAALGISLPFWLFWLSNVGIVAALLWWRPPRKSAESLPAERLVSAVRVGIRYAANNRYLGATLIRTAAFFPFACAYWALLPLVARSQAGQGPQFYGALLGAIGVGAVAGSFAQAWAKAKMGPDRIVALGTLATALALVLFGLARDPSTAVGACLIAGASWTLVLTNLYVSAQFDLPDWVRGRGLATLLTIIFGATTFGSVIWGKLAELEGLPIAHFVAAGGIVVGIPLTWRWKLQTGAGLDLSPALHWRAPTVTRKIDDNRGPVLVTVQYRVDAKNRAELRHERKRDGAFAWNAFEEPVDSDLIVETFLIESWLELMHTGERVTNADRVQKKKLIICSRGRQRSPPWSPYRALAVRRRLWRKALSCRLDEQARTRILRYPRTRSGHALVRLSLATPMARLRYRSTYAKV
jgi:predicted MFS family arabinose efflux permease